MRKNGRYMRALALTMMLAFALTGAAAAAAKKAVVVAKSVDVYEKPKTGSSVLGTLKKGAEVTFVRASGNIAQIKYAGKTGYVKKSAIRLLGAENKPAASATPAPAPKSTPAPAAVTSAAARKKTTVRALAYLEPSTACKKHTTVRKGTAFDILGETGDFYRVRRAGQTAYLLKTAFAPQAAAPKAPTPAPTPTPTPAPIATKALSVKSPVYKKASKSSKVLGTLDAGTRVDVLAEGKSFVKIRLNGQTGFVPAKAFAAPAAPAPTPAPTPAPKGNAGGAPSRSVNASKANAVIAAAMAQLGKRYVYGTTGPSTFDCSGLTYYAYRQVGVTLPHSAHSVGYGSGQKVAREHLQRGDIVCFDTVSDSDLSDHVGIYLGNSQFVHASSGQGRVVVSTISGYYAERFSWGRRVL